MTLINKYLHRHLNMYWTLFISAVLNVCSDKIRIYHSFWFGFFWHMLCRGVKEHKSSAAVASNDNKGNSKTHNCPSPTIILNSVYSGNHSNGNDSNNNITNHSWRECVSVGYSHAHAHVQAVMPGTSIQTYHTSAFFNGCSNVYF